MLFCHLPVSLLCRGAACLFHCFIVVLLVYLDFSLFHCCAYFTVSLFHCCAGPRLTILLTLITFHFGEPAGYDMIPLRRALHHNFTTNTSSVTLIISNTLVISRVITIIISMARLGNLPPPKNYFLGLCPKLWVGGGQES